MKSIFLGLVLLLCLGGESFAQEYVGFCNRVHNIYPSGYYYVPILIYPQIVYHPYVVYYPVYQPYVYSYHYRLPGY
jgi:hypothetical protein